MNNKKIFLKIKKHKIIILIVLLSLAFLATPFFSILIERSYNLFFNNTPLLMDCIPCTAGNEKCIIEHSRNNFQCCIHHPDTDFCMFQYAVANRDSKPCYSIREPLRTNCFIALAALAGNENLCELVGEEKEFCLAVNYAYFKKEECQNIHDNGTRDFCYYSTAEMWNNLEACEKIENENEKKECFSVLEHGTYHSS